MYRSRNVVLALGLAFTLAASWLLAAERWSNAALVGALTKADGLVQINEKRIEISPEVKLLCARPDRTQFKTHLQLSTSYSPYADVLVTPDGVDAMRQADGVFPVGTIIYKRKFPSQDAREPELYTGMLKREAGYNPACGDWEFFTLTGNGKVVTARGKIDSCIECHREYPKNDFVTKSYGGVRK